MLFIVELTYTVMIIAWFEYEYEFLKFVLCVLFIFSILVFIYLVLIYILDYNSLSTTHTRPISKLVLNLILAVKSYWFHWFQSYMLLLCYSTDLFQQCKDACLHKLSTFQTYLLAGSILNDNQFVYVTWFDSIYFNQYFYLQSYTLLLYKLTLQ